MAASVVDQHQDEVWAEDSDTAEHMTQDPAGLEDYVLASAGQLFLLVYYRVGNVKGLARELTLEVVAHGMNPSQHILLSVTRLMQSFHALMRHYPPPVERITRGGGTGWACGETISSEAWISR